MVKNFRCDRLEALMHELTWHLPAIEERRKLNFTGLDWLLSYRKSRSDASKNRSQQKPLARSKNRQMTDDEMEGIGASSRHS
jgi:hypothetical protein